jgi:hypothetical protein
MWHLRKYRKVFVGSQAVDWLISPASGLALATRYTRHNTRAHTRTHLDARPQAHSRGRAAVQHS